jgi:hypothetical protein
MAKLYKDRQMVTDNTGSEEVYFFPKHNPPISIRAKSQKEAEEKLAALDNKKHD